MKIRIQKTNWEKLRKYFPIFFTEDYLKKLFKKDKVNALIGYHKGEPIAFIYKSIVDIPLKSKVEFVFVKDEYRGNGIAKVLQTRMEKKYGIFPDVTIVPTNVPSLICHLKMGFKIVGYFNHVDIPNNDQVIKRGLTYRVGKKRISYEDFREVEKLLCEVNIKKLKVFLGSRQIDFKKAWNDRTIVGYYRLQK
jgi:hypothetical protein